MRGVMQTALHLGRISLVFGLSVKVSERFAGVNMLHTLREFNATFSNRTFSYELIF